MNRINLPSLITIGLALVVLDMLSLSVARADDRVVAWTAPTLNEDGSTLTDLAGFVISYSTDPAVPTNNMQSVTLTDKALTRYTVTGLTPGTWYFTMRAVNASGANSVRTAIVNTVVAAPATRPKPPGGLQVTAASVSPTAYSVIKSNQQLVLLPVGTLPLGTPCDTAQGVVRGGNLFNVVPTSAVTYSGTARPLVVLAACSG